MSQRLSRPAQWDRAIRRANGAIDVAIELRAGWMSKLKALRDALEDLRTQRAAVIDDLADALADLIVLQSEYQNRRTQIPENLEETTYAWKLDNVQSFSFDYHREHLREEGQFPLEDRLEAALDSEDLEEPFLHLVAELDRAETFNLPKGYGRD